VSDALVWGRKIRMLTMVDAFTREALAIEVDTSLSGVRVARVLDRVIAARGQAPAEIVLDNGPELTSNLSPEEFRTDWTMRLAPAALQL
jgi:putative transposase